MRHLFLILMIALLPLRGWASDAMATVMATAQVQHQQTAASPLAARANDAGVPAHQYGETVAADAVQTASDCSSHAFGQDEHADDTHCNTCSACQACHTVALTPAPAFSASAAPNLGALPRAEVAQFTSAQAALGQKPPIS